MPVAEVGVELPEDVLDHTSNDCAGNAVGTGERAHHLEESGGGFSVGLLQLFGFLDCRSHCHKHEGDDEHEDNSNDVAGEVDDEEAETSTDGFLPDQDKDVG